MLVDSEYIITSRSERGPSLPERGPSIQHFVDKNAERPKVRKRRKRSRAFADNLRGCVLCRAPEAVESEAARRVCGECDA